MMQIISTEIQLERMLWSFPFSGWGNQAPERFYHLSKAPQRAKRQLCGWAHTIFSWVCTFIGIAFHQHRHQNHTSAWKVISQWSLDVTVWALRTPLFSLGFPNVINIKYWDDCGREDTQDSDFSTELETLLPGFVEGGGGCQTSNECKFAQFVHWQGSRKLCTPSAPRPSASHVEGCSPHSLLHKRRFYTTAPAQPYIRCRESVMSVDDAADANAETTTVSSPQTVWLRS